MRLWVYNSALHGPSTIILCHSDLPAFSVLSHSNRLIYLLGCRDNRSLLTRCDQVSPRSSTSCRIDRLELEFKTGFPNLLVLYKMSSISEATVYKSQALYVLFLLSTADVGHRPIDS